MLDHSAPPAARAAFRKMAAAAVLAAMAAATMTVCQPDAAPAVQVATAPLANDGEAQ